MLFYDTKQGGAKSTEFTNATQAFKSWYSKSTKISFPSISVYTKENKRLSSNFNGMYLDKGDVYTVINAYQEFLNQLKIEIDMLEEMRGN